jgi:hypothetical protein
MIEDTGNTEGAFAGLGNEVFGDKQLLLWQRHALANPVAYPVFGLCLRAGSVK